LTLVFGNLVFSPFQCPKFKRVVFGFNRNNEATARHISAAAQIIDFTLPCASQLYKNYNTRLMSKYFILNRYRTRLIHPYATCLRARDWIGRPTSMARRGTACTPITNTRARRFCTAMSISRRNSSLNHLRCSATNGRPTNSHSSTTLAVPKGIA